MECRRETDASAMQRLAADSRPITKASVETLKRPPLSLPEMAESRGSILLVNLSNQIRQRQSTRLKVFSQDFSELLLAESNSRNYLYLTGYKVYPKR